MPKEIIKKVHDKEVQATKTSKTWLKYFLAIETMLANMGEYVLTTNMST
jgi:hypothetical protein